MYTTINTWNFKIDTLLQNAAGNVDFRYEEKEDGSLYFCETTNRAFYLPEHSQISFDPRKKAQVARLFDMHDTQEWDSQLATQQETISHGKLKLRKFATDDGRVAFVQEKLLKIFPKHALFYVPKMGKSTVLVCLEDGSGIHRISLVCQYVILKEAK